MRKRWRAARPLLKVLGAGGLVVLLAAVGTGAWWFTHKDSAAAASPAAATRQVAASLTTLQQSVSGTGTLTPAVQEDVSFAVGGTVTSVAVAAGDTVTAGQTLATVDTLELDADLLSAKATLAKAEATLADAQDAADGTDSSDAQIAAAAAQVEVAQAAVDDATAAVADATLVAPVAGLLTTVDLAVGDVVAGSGSSASSGASAGGSTSTAAGGTTGTTTASSAPFVIVGTDAWSVEVSVDETDIASVAVGQQVELTSDSLDETVYGTVATIGLLSTSTSGVAAYPVTIAVTGSPAGLHDGVSVTAEIIWSKRTDVLTVPSQAVTTADDGTTTVTQLDADGAEVEVPVEVGETVDAVTEITSGLAEGDEVVVQTFTPGAAGGTGTGTTDGTDAGTRGGFPTDGQLPTGEMPAMPGAGG